MPINRSCSIQAHPQESSSLLRTFNLFQRSGYVPAGHCERLSWSTRWILCSPSNPAHDSSSACRMSFDSVSRFRRHGRYTETSERVFLNRDCAFAKTMEGCNTCSRRVEASSDADPKNGGVG